MQRTVIIVNGKSMHLVLGKSVSEWKNTYGNESDVWYISLEEFLDGTMDVCEEIWYWYINGRCYETIEEV